jgi:hypothetical protein
LEISQLQAALKALSEKLKLLQNIEKDRNAIAKQLDESEGARSELKRQLEETSTKSKLETEKLHQYQEILLKENDQINHTMLEMRQELTIAAD